MTVPFLYKLKTNTNGHDIIDANVFSFKLMRFPSRKRKTGPYYTINVHEKFNTSNQMFCCTLNSSLGIWWNIFWETKKKVGRKLHEPQGECVTTPSPTWPRSLRQTSCRLSSPRMKNTQSPWVLSEAYDISWMTNTVNTPLRSPKWQSQVSPLQSCWFYKNRAGTVWTLEPRELFVIDRCLYCTSVP